MAALKNHGTPLLTFTKEDKQETYHAKETIQIMSDKTIMVKTQFRREDTSYKNVNGSLTPVTKEYWSSEPYKLKRIKGKVFKIGESKTLEEIRSVYIKLGYVEN